MASEPDHEVPAIALDAGAAGVRVGVDLVSVERVERLLERYEHARTRLFTERELAGCEGRRHAGEHLAARFAAKEAIFKLLGRGIGDGLRWRDVEVLSDERGQPAATLSGRAAEWAAQAGVRSLGLSLSHDAGLAIAQATALTDGSQLAPR